MELQLENPEFLASVASVRSTVVSLTDARAHASRSVDSLLSRWDGAAAADFASAWSTWLSASRSVAAALDAMADLLAAYHSSVQAVDAVASSSLGALQERLS